MKNVKMNYRLMAIALFVVTSLAFSSAAIANDDNKKATPAIEIRFLGNAENQPVFLLSLTGTEKDEYTITIKDESGYVLYSDVETGINISKKFRLNTETIGFSPLTVEIKSKNTKAVQAFQIGRTQKVVVETVVNKIK